MAGDWQGIGKGLVRDWQGIGKGIGRSARKKNFLAGGRGRPRATYLPTTLPPEALIPERLIQLCGRSGRGLGAGYTVQREHLVLLGWAERLSGYSVRFGGLGGLGGGWGLTIQYRGIIRGW